MYNTKERSVSSQRSTAVFLAGRNVVVLGQARNGQHSFRIDGAEASCSSMATGLLIVLLCTAAREEERRIMTRRCGRAAQQDSVSVAAPHCPTLLVNLICQGIDCPCAPLVPRSTTSNGGENCSA